MVSSLCGTSKRNLKNMEAFTEFESCWGLIKVTRKFNWAGYEPDGLLSLIIKAAKSKKLRQRSFIFFLLAIFK